MFTGSTVQSRRYGAAFLLPLAALLWANHVGASRPATGADLLEVAAVCVTSGVAWQVLHRRDLVDRLTHFASGFTVLSVLLFGMAWDATWSFSIGLGVGLSAVLTGCVYTEQWLRARDLRRVRAQDHMVAEGRSMQNSTPEARP